MANGKKGQKLFTSDEVNEIVRKRLARAKQDNNVQYIPGYRVTTLPWASESRAKEEPELTLEEEYELQEAEQRAYEEEQKAVARVWWRKEIKKVLGDGMPDHPTGRWLQIATEIMNDAKEEVQELRANGGEQRAIDGIQSQIDELQELYEKVDAARNASMLPVYPEVRATKAELDEAAAKFAFLPEDEKKAIRERIMKAQQPWALNQADQIIRQCFTKGILQ